MDEIDCGIGFQQIAPGALARVRFARDQKHAQIFANALHRHRHLVVGRCHFALQGINFNLDDMVAGMNDLDLSMGHIAGAHAQPVDQFAINLDADIEPGTAGNAQIIDAEGEGLAVADQAEARRGEEGDATVDFIVATGDQGMQGGAQAKA